MKIILSFFLAMSPLIIFSQAFDLNTKDAKVDFVFLSDDVKGTITEVEAKVLIDRKQLSKSQVIGFAHVRSLSTKNKIRDKHLKSSDFFDVEKFPTIKFNATSIVESNGKLLAKGQLTIKDVTKEVVFGVTNVNGQLIFAAKINASDFGVSPKKQGKSEVSVKVRIPLK